MERDSVQQHEEIGPWEIRILPGLAQERVNTQKYTLKEILVEQSDFQ